MLIMERYENAQAHRAQAAAQLEYALKHLTFIAEQRIKTFNFYRSSRGR